MRAQRRNLHAIGDRRRVALVINHTSVGELDVFNICQLVEAFHPIYRSRTIKPNRIFSAEADEACGIHAGVALYDVVSEAPKYYVTRPSRALPPLSPVSVSLKALPTMFSIPPRMSPCASPPEPRPVRRFTLTAAADAE